MTERTNPDANPLFDPNGNPFTDAWIDHWEQPLVVNHKNPTIMNEQNLAYLQDQLKYLGFGEHWGEALQTKLSEGTETFSLRLDTEVAKTPISADLHFSKGKEGDRYYLNRWDATLKTPEGSIGQSFPIYRGSGVTLKEAFNLLEGRAVYKQLPDRDGQKHGAWLQLDKDALDKNGNYKVRQYHPGYGYNLEKVLSSLPIKELLDPTAKERLLYSLQKGNRTAATFETKGGVEQLHLEAVPKFKSLNVYTEGGELLSTKDLVRRLDLPRTPAKDVSLLGRAAAEGEHPLLEKKHTNPSKGLHP